MSEVRAAIIHTDGACLGNPSPAGAGFVIADQQGVQLAEGCIPIGHGTNNIAEYHAVVAGLEKAAELGLTHIIVRSDSELLCKQMWGQYKVKAANLKRLHIQVREAMRKLTKVLFEHVPREKNERADKLAGEAARKAKGVDR